MEVAAQQKNVRIKFNSEFIFPREFGAIHVERKKIRGVRSRKFFGSCIIYSVAGTGITCNCTLSFASDFPPLKENTDCSIDPSDLLFLYTT